jgi:hypothetical protein
VPDIGLYEERTRVVCHLPCSNEKHECAFQDILKYLRKHRTAAIPVNGYTMSTTRPVAFIGNWFGKPSSLSDQLNARNRWIPDKIVLLVVDYEINFSDQRLSRLVQDLKNELATAYSKWECPETDFWVVAQQIFRHAD